MSRNFSSARALIRILTVDATRSVVLESDRFGPESGNGNRYSDLSEVTIGRRLTRDKESHYLINGEAVRLKDVRDLLMDTGLGVGATTNLPRHI